MVQFDQFDNPIPFTATLLDTTDYGPQLYSDTVAGKYGPIGDYVPPKKLSTTGTTGSAP